MLTGDLIAVRSFPAVVQAADVRALRSGPDDDQDIDDFVSGYLGFDERSRYALATVTGALARLDRGGAFFLNGVFGSGKSHLLGLLALLCDGRGHGAFAATHPHLAPLLETFAPRLVVHFSLDDYDAARFSLEEVFWREVKNEWARRGLPPDALSLPPAGPRSEFFAALDEALAAHQLSGLVVCIDELSLFLSAKEHRALQGDAAFLQFIGQRARRAPLWVFAALQKTVEDIGELESYSLSQIRDRFTTLPLSLAHLPSLIERRLIIKKDTAALALVCHDSFADLNRALPRLDFGPAEWEGLYPFHPATVGLLEQVVARFFSRTRSAALFCAHTARAALDEDAARRVLPAALFDYLRPELETHPDLRPLAGVWDSWRESLPEIAPDPREAEALRRLMQGLLLFKIAGTAPTLAQLANAVALDARLPGDGNYEYARVLLEKLRSRGSFLAVERHEGDFADRYAIDLGTRVGEMARRHTANALQTLPQGDTRIAHYAALCCRDEPLPLAGLETTGGATVQWRNAPRRLAIGLWSEALSTEAIVNRLAALSAPGHAEDALLLLAPPFAGAEEAAREACRAAAREMPDARWRAALLLWTPRPPAHDEWEQAREATAQHLLEGDPQLLDNRRGRAILAHLKTGAPQREAALGRIAARLLREGVVTTGAGAAIDAAELAGGESWLATLESLADFALPRLFPQFEEVAPRLRVLSGSNADALCLDILRRPASAPFFAPSLERAARAIGEPLGVARAEGGRWRIAPLRDDLGQTIKALAAETGTALSSIEAQLAKGEWGLTPEQTAIALCALLRSGDLAASDARGHALAPGEIGLPLRRAIHTLRPGQLLDAAAWAQLSDLLAVLTGDRLGPVAFAEQERARSLLAAWRDDALAETELAQARLHQMRRQLHHTPAQWPCLNAAWEQIEALLRALDGPGATAAALLHAATVDPATLRPALETWRATLAALEARHAALLAGHAFLSHAELSTPPDLQPERATLLGRYDAGEALLDDLDLPAGADAWRAVYADRYAQWHAAQHNPARFATLRRLSSGEALRALELLSNLTARPFPHAASLRAALAAELDKGCPRDGTLRGDPVCPDCRLRWGERLALRDPRELEAVAAAGLTTLRAALQESPVNAYLSRDGAAPLLDWSQSNDGADALLPLLTPATLRALDEALRPRRHVTRSWPQLQAALSACRTRADFESVFRGWLDGGEGLNEDDEIEVDFEGA